MAREDVSVGGVVYYGYSLEAPEDWAAALKELKRNMNSAPVSVDSDGLTLTFRYSWMSAGNNVFKVTAADTERGLAFTVYNTGLGNVWAWVGGEASVDVNAPKWNGRTSGTVWDSGTTGVSTSATSVSFANVRINPSANSGKKATAAYLVEVNNHPLVYPNDKSSSFTPFATSLSGTPVSTEAKTSIFGPIHAPALAGVSRGGTVFMPSQTTQVTPYGSYCFTLKGQDSDGNDATLTTRFQGVMMNDSGGAMLFMAADTGTSTYDEE